MGREQYFSYLRLAGIASLTLGLAPFVPEPHIFGKLRWLWGGAVGMQSMDWFDLALHGIPWLLFMALLLYGLFTHKLFSGKRDR
jgi:hypothetical protein